MGIWESKSGPTVKIEQVEFFLLFIKAAVCQVKHKRLANGVLNMTIQREGQFSAPLCDQFSCVLIDLCVSQEIKDYLHPQCESYDTILSALVYFIPAWLSELFLASVRRNHNHCQFSAELTPSQYISTARASAPSTA